MLEQSPQDIAEGYEVVEAQGKPWHLRHVGAGIRLTISRWAKSKVRQSIRDQLQWQSAVENREDLALFQSECAAGHYDWGRPEDPRGIGTGLVTVLQGSDGQLRLLRELLKDKHGELDDEALAALVADVPEDFVRAMKICMGMDPNPLSPASTTTTNGSTPGTSPNDTANALKTAATA